MSPLDYRIERERRGTQTSVAALLRVDPQTISRRERGEIPITHEAALALLSLPKNRKRRGHRTLRVTHRSGAEVVCNRLFIVDELKAGLAGMAADWLATPEGQAALTAALAASAPSAAAATPPPAPERSSP